MALLLKGAFVSNLMILDGEFDNATEIKGEFGVLTKVGGSGTPYTGSYVVIPTSSEQILETNQKYMTDDVTVRKIPYFETSNESGKTVYIGNV